MLWLSHVADADAVGTVPVERGLSRSPGSCRLRASCQTSAAESRRCWGRVNQPARGCDWKRSGASSYSICRGGGLLGGGGREGAAWSVMVLSLSSSFADELIGGSALSFAGRCLWVGPGQSSRSRIRNKRQRGWPWTCWREAVYGMQTDDRGG